jgi:hypothetical protein
MIMKHRKQNVAKVTSQVRELGPRVSFLDILQDACAHNGRYTLTAESDGQMFTVLVDRGGPFNAIGGGTSGSSALVAAAQLRSGRCTVSMGWPVDQPLYQPGLDLTLRGLVEGVVEPSTLPRHRGVDSLRNQEWREVAPAVPAEYAPAPVPMSMQPTPAPAPSVATPATPVPAPPPLAAEEPGSAVDAAPAGLEQAREAIQPAVAAVPAPAAFPTRPWVHAEAATDAPAANRSTTAWSGHGNDAVLPATTEGPAAITSAKHFATQALLWLCEVEDEKEYSLQEAATLARHNLVEGLSQAVHPFRKEMSTHIHRIKEDWEKSGEAAARATRKKRVKVATSDADEEFRLF